MKWTPIYLSDKDFKHRLSGEGTFPYTETEIVFEDGFEPQMTSEELHFVDQKTKNSIPPEYHISVRQYTFHQNNNTFTNITDGLIQEIKRIKNIDDNVPNESVVNDLKSIRKMVSYELMFSISLYYEGRALKRCSRNFLFYGFVSDLYRNYFEINHQFLSFSVNPMSTRL